MNPNQFVDAVREENGTALSALGSVAAGSVGGDDGMAPEQLLRMATDETIHARETFEEWAAAEGNEDAAETYRTTADEAGEQYGRLARRLDGDHEPDDTPEIHRYLRDTEDTAGRAGAFVGRTVALARFTDHLVGVFADHADTGSADLFRDRTDVLDAQLERGEDLLLAICETDDEWARARETADDTVQAASRTLSETD